MRAAMSDEDDKPIPREWLEEFEAAARRPLEQRWRYSFIKTYKPVLDDAPYRVFDTMEQYRRRSSVLKMRGAARSRSPASMSVASTTSSRVNALPIVRRIVNQSSDL